MVPTSTEPALKCKHCGSSLLVKYGKYKGRQLYWCQACQKKVKGNSDPFRMRVPAEYVSLTLDLYFQGLSIQDICDYLGEKYDYHPSKHVVFDWVNKFTAKAISYFRHAQPEVSTTWIADETMLALDKHRKAWLWDIIDARTRFLLATMVSFTRSESDAKLVMEQACARASKRPQTVMTGKADSYIDSNVLAFGAGTDRRRAPPLDIRAAADLSGPCHGKLKERTKVLSGFRDVDTFLKFNDGFRVHYNFLRPHKVLKGKTPAEAANINYDLAHWVHLASLPVTGAAQAASPPDGTRKATKVKHVAPYGVRA